MRLDLRRTIGWLSVLAAPLMLMPLTALAQYDLTIDFEQVHRVTNAEDYKSSESSYRDRAIVAGNKSHISIKSENKKKDKHKDFKRSRVAFASSDGSDVLAACNELAMAGLDSPNPEGSYFEVKAYNVPKHIVMKPPKKFKKNRKKIRIGKRILKKLNRAVRIVKSDKAKKAIGVLIKKVEKKLDQLREEQAKILASDKKWKPRRHIYLNVDRFEVSCEIAEKEFKHKKKGKKKLKRLLKRIAKR